MLQKGFIALGRFLISMVFLASGMSKILHWQQQEGELLSALSEWHAYFVFSDELQALFSALIPWTALLLGLGMLFEFVGGLMILLGMRERLGATLLISCLLPQAIIMHPFWFLEGMMREVQMAYFLKDLAILGGLFFVLLREASSMRSFPSIKLS